MNATAIAKFCHSGDAAALTKYALSHCDEARVRNAYSLESAPRQQKDAAGERVKDSADHIVVSWSEEESKHLTNEQVFDFANRLIEKLDRANVTATVAIHRNTPRVHAHIIAGSCDPTNLTGRGEARRVSRSWSYVTLGVATLEVETEMKMLHGRYAKSETKGQRSERRRSQKQLFPSNLHSGRTLDREAKLDNSDEARQARLTAAFARSKSLTDAELDKLADRPGGLFADRLAALTERANRQARVPTLRDKVTEAKLSPEMAEILARVNREAKSPARDRDLLPEKGLRDLLGPHLSRERRVVPFR